MTTVNIVLPHDPSVEEWIDDQGFDQMSYIQRWQQYRLRITQRDVSERTEQLQDLIRRSHQHRNTT